MQIINSNYIESYFECVLPDDYKKFLDTQGYGVINNIEIYGFSEKTIDENVFPCVIGATNKFRNDKILSEYEIAIASDDIVIFGINCKNKKYFKKYISGKIEYIKSPFEYGFN